MDIFNLRRGNTNIAKMEILRILIRDESKLNSRSLQQTTIKKNGIF